MPLAAGARLGPYEILSSLGAGGMGEVYRARDGRLERIVALKVLPSHLASSPDALARFEREAKAVAALSHPNILAIHDFGVEDGMPYAVMELLEGATLRERLAESEVPVRRVIDWAQQIARGLVAAHDRGIVHRDLKPENLFVTRDGLVKILDFGLATQTPAALDRENASDRATAAATQEGAILGTVGYMSPEQARGKPADPRSDIFSFGAILYEMLAGRRAFERESPVDTMVAILHEQPPHLSNAGRQVSPELSEIVAHCLEKSPDDRFQTSRDLSFALQVAEREARAPKSDAGPSSDAAAAPLLSSSSSAAAVSAGPPSIAVLPFRNMSADPEAEYFSDGMTEEIITALSGIPELRVTARTTSFAFKGKDDDVRRIGRELGVRTVLEGSVRQAGNRLRITAQLIDVNGGYHLWSERFDREMADVFAIQDEIARAIAATLKVRLFEEAGAPLVSPQTRDVAAYDHYLKGRYLWARRRTKLAAIEFQRAIEIDPDYAAAYTGLADTYAVWGFYGGIPTWEAYGRARSAVERTESLTPDSAALHLSLGIVEHYYGWNVAREERELRLAQEKDPKASEPWFWLALCLSVIDRFDDSLDAARRAVAAEPHSANAQASVGWAYAGAGRWEEAVPEFDKAVRLDPDAAFPVWSLGLAKGQIGDREGSVSTLEHAVGVTEREHSFEIALLVEALAGAGYDARARDLFEELLQRSKATYVPPFDLALAASSLRRKEEALAWLERAYDERNAMLWFRMHLPAFDLLVGEPRFRAIADRLARTAPLKRNGGW